MKRANFRFTSVLTTGLIYVSCRFPVCAVVNLVRSKVQSESFGGGGGNRAAEPRLRKMLQVVSNSQKAHARWILHVLRAAQSKFEWQFKAKYL